MGAAALGGLLGYAHLETKLFELRRVRVPVLAAGSAPIRILHLSDIHLLTSQHAKIAWLHGLGALGPDVVVTTGDNIASAAAIPVLRAAMAPLLRLPGVFAFGSNDYWAPEPKSWARYLRADSRGPQDLAPLPWPQLHEVFTESGWRDLNNLRDQVELADGRVLTFVGTDDAHLDYDDFPGRGPEYRPAAVLTHGGLAVARGSGRACGSGKACAGQGALHLGVTHAPYARVLAAMRADQVALTLAGHTHGGQLCLPGYGALVTNCDLPRKQASGLSRWPLGVTDGMWLHVSAGAGTSPYAPFRFACHPSATLLTLTAC